MGLVVEVLGPIRVGGESGTQLGRRSHRRLLSLLALDGGQRVSTDVLIDRFWPGEPPPTARTALQTHVSALRRLLGDASIVTDGSGYRLDLDGGTLDAERFRELAASARSLADDADWRGCLEAAQEALVLWRGEPPPSSHC